ncbi:hypothetical protein HY489_02875 [Candidatus Woesearchaeota archaeon]|nr:hypothetical protein [Candidatus Woesearchaeota archaeon]
MKALIALLFVLAVPVLAQNGCMDSDSSSMNVVSSLGLPGWAAAGKLVARDECVDGKTIKEAFCAKGIATGKAFDCTKYGFAGCKELKTGAACIKTEEGTCGDYNLNPWEECDPPGADCTVQRLSLGVAAQPGTCSAQCKCLPGPRCGDARVDQGEECDPPGQRCLTGRGEWGVCSKMCGCFVPQGGRCGDGRLDAGETCDPPNGACTKEGVKGVCSQFCTCLTSIPFCGDRQVSGREQCDPPGGGCVTAAGEQGTCNNACACVPGPRCGNQQREGNEECDPPGSACTSLQVFLGTCSRDCKCQQTVTRCGDGRRDSLEQCDPPGRECMTIEGSWGTCSRTCMCTGRPVTGITPGACGNQVPDIGEQCDPPGGRCALSDGKIGVCDRVCRCMPSTPAMLYPTRVTVPQTAPAIVRGPIIPSGVSKPVRQMPRPANATIVASQILVKR